MLTTLARASIDGAVFTALIWLLTRHLPRLSPAAKAALWWLVSVKFIVALIWTTPIPLAVLPAGHVASRLVALPAANANAGPAAGDRAAPGAPALAGVLTALWATGLALSLLAGYRRWRTVRTAIARSHGAADPVHAITCEIAARLRVAPVPDVRLSDGIETPLVAGVIQPVIVVPGERFDRLGGERQRMTICHELAHIKRRDLWFGWAVAVAERVFFFHPLARLAAREYVFWREAACDAVVIDTLGATPHDYARLLLDFGIAAPRRTLAAAGAAWSFGNLKRRIVMLGRPSPRSSASRLASAAALAVATVGLVPIALTAQPVAPQQSRAASAPNTDQSAFVAFHDDGTTTMSGSSDEMTRARQLRREGEAMLWVRRNGVEYIVRDPATLLEIRDIWKRVTETGNQQGLVGLRQGELGARQGAVGLEQGALGAQQGMLGARQAELAARQLELAASELKATTAAERNVLGRVHADVQSQMQALELQLRALDSKMPELQAQLAALSDRMADFTSHMDALSRRMNEATQEAEAKMRDLIDRTIASGLAQIVR
jgi:beta-lactamase regulating signal transducer with metallopeptidase domain